MRSSKASARLPTKSQSISDHVLAHPPPAVVAYLSSSPRAGPARDVLQVALGRCEVVRSALHVVLGAAEVASGARQEVALSGAEAVRGGR